MSQFLPLFPLNLVVFPGEQLNLHIFEQRYRELIHDCKDGKSLFGIPTKINDQELEIGTIVSLEEISKIYPDGKMDVRCEALDIFKLDNYKDPYDSKLYAAGKITLLDTTDDTDYLLNEKLIELVQELYKFMGINKTIDTDPARFNLYDVAHKIGLTVNQEYQLLQIPSARERQIFGVSHLENLIPVVRKMEMMRRKIQMNGHFKNIPS